MRSVAHKQWGDTTAFLGQVRVTQQVIGFRRVQQFREEVLSTRELRLVAVQREGKRVTSQVRRTTIRPGDILLLLVPKETGADVTEWLGCLPLAERGLAVRRLQLPRG